MADPKRRPLPRPLGPRDIKIKPRPKKPGKTPVTVTRGGREVGIGGLKRLRNIDDIVDKTQSGKK